jgi:hypothetical protein
VSKVHHRQINQRIEPLADDFPSLMHEALNLMADSAIALNAVVDWSTLCVIQPDQFETYDSAGKRQVYSTGPLTLTVDSIHIEEDE